MGDNLKKSVSLGLCFGVIMGACFDIIYSGVDGIIVGLLSGILLTVVFFISINSQTKKMKAIKDTILKTGNIIFEGSANHFVNKKPINGWLFLTQNNLIFINNNQSHKLEIPIDAIKSCEISKNLKIVANRFLIKTYSDQDEIFIVSNTKEWIEYINKACLQNR